MKDRPHATLEMRNNETAIPCFILWVVKCILHTHACSKKKGFTNFQWFWIHWTLITHFINYLCQILYCHNLSLFLPDFGETLFELYKKHAEFYDWTIHMYYLPSNFWLHFSSINSRYLAHQNESSHNKKNQK